MSDNTHRFTGKAEAYERFRQRYPAQEVLALLRDWCDLTPTNTIADIGAGTGMLSEVFLENGNAVTAIEPNDEMRAACAHLQAQWPALTVLNATAESTTLPSTSINIVTAGRSFHWFDTERALAEFRRILEPNGWVALVSAGRTDDDTPQALAFEHVLATFGKDRSYTRATYRVHDKLEDLFLDLHQAEIHGNREMDWQTLLGSSESLSDAPQPHAPNYEAFTQALRHHFDTYAQDGILTVATTCWVSAGRLSTQ